MLTFLRFFSFFHICSIIFATSVNPLVPNQVQTDPYNVIYNTHIGSIQFQDNSVFGVINTLCDIPRSDVIQKYQRFQKIFLLSTVKPTIDFKEHRECSFSTQSLEKRRQFRSLIMQLTNDEQERIKTVLQDAAKEQGEKQKEEDLLKKITVFEVLVKLDEYQDEHWQDDNLSSSFDSLLTKSIEELMKANMTTAVENLKNWKSLILQEDRKRLIQQEFLLCLQPVWNQAILQRSLPFKDFVVTLMAFSFALTLIEKAPMMFLGNSQVELNPIEQNTQNNAITNRTRTITPTLQASETFQGVWKMTLLQQMNPNYSTSYTIPSIIFCLTLFYYFIPMMHQLDYGITYFVKWRNWWNEKINTEELTAEMIGIVYDKTKNLTAEDFKAVVANIKAILPDMMRGRYPFVLSWPPLSNEHFNEEFRKKVDGIVSKVKKTVVLT